MKMLNLGNYVVPIDTLKGTCLDVGCNLGDFTYKFKDHFSDITYIEPQKALFDKLKERFSKFHHIRGINRAAWSQSGVKLSLIEHHTLDHGSVAVSSNNLNDEWDDGNKVNDCLSISIEEFNFYIDYLKIDCETSEYEFLNKKNLENIQYIGIELHHQLGSEKYNELISWIEKTHKLSYGNYNFTTGINKEVLFSRK